MSLIEKLKKLRNELKKYDLDGFYISTSDEFNGEYVSNYARRLEYISGFTGSNGICVITQNKGYLFTDGRYILQAKIESGEFFEIINIYELYQYLTQMKINNLGLDFSLITQIKKEEIGILVQNLVNINLIDIIWENKPFKPNSKPFLLQDKYSGKKWEEKNLILGEKIKHYKANSFFTNDYHAICWLLNIRGRDLKYTPIIQSMMLWTSSKIFIFLYEPNRMNNIENNFSEKVEFLDINNLPNHLKKLRDKKILIDIYEINAAIYELLTKEKFEIIKDVNPIKYLKMIKNESEINAIKIAQKQDLIALTEFKEFLNNSNVNNLNEYDLAKKMSEIRLEKRGCISLSFEPIVGYKENGAIIHYHPSKDESKKILGKGLLLVDSGSQYLGATTDVTRTFSIGKPNKYEKLLYTLVLKGQIALLNAIFPKNIKGSNLEILARKFLWEYELDYPHSTGHGVGAGLSVHEGLHAISFNNQIPLEAGMIVTNEPGIYLEGKFGIRLENMMLVKEYSNNMLCFENLTFAPYEEKLINYDILNKSDVKWLEDYNKKIKKMMKY